MIKCLTSLEYECSSVGANQSLLHSKQTEKFYNQVVGEYGAQIATLGINWNTNMKNKNYNLSSSPIPTQTKYTHIHQDKM